MEKRLLQLGSQIRNVPHKKPDFSVEGELLNRDSRDMTLEFHSTDI